MIVKTKDIGLNQSLTVQALAPPENVQGNHGPQLKWRVQCNGQEGLMWTNIYPNGPDKIGRAMASGEPVTLTRVWDAAKNKSVVEPSKAGAAPALTAPPAFPAPPTFPVAPVSFPPPTSFPMGPAPAPLSTPGMPVWQGKPAQSGPSDREKGIVYLALFKTLGTPQDTPADNHQRTVAAYEEFQQWLTGEDVPDFLADADGMPFSEDE